MIEFVNEFCHSQAERFRRPGACVWSTITMSRYCPTRHFLLGHREQVEDVVQQAFMLAFDRLADSQAFRGNPWKWLRGTVRNLVYDVWRQPRRLLQDVADLLHQVVLEADEAGDGMDRSRVREALRRCLDTLGEGDRRLIDQRYEKGWRIFKIARQMKISLWPNLLHRATGRPRCITPNQEGTLKPGDNQIVLKIRGAAAVLGTSDAVPRTSSPRACGCRICPTNFRRIRTWWSSGMPPT